MRITFEEVLSRSTYLHEEILSSISTDLIDKCIDDGFYDIKLLINGTEVEPKCLNDVFTKLDKYIEGTAHKILEEKFQTSLEKVRRLENIIEQASSETIDLFNVNYTD